MATILDPRFSLKWCQEGTKLQSDKQHLQATVSDISIESKHAAVSPPLKR